jgi:hypothetical protein
MSYYDDLRQFKLAYWKHALESTKGSVTQAARVSGLDRTHLCKILKDLGLIGHGRLQTHIVTRLTRRDLAPRTPGQRMRPGHRRRKASAPLSLKAPPE